MTVLFGFMISTKELKVISLNHSRIQQFKIYFDTAQKHVLLFFFFQLRVKGEGKSPHIPKICHTYPKMMRLGTVLPYLKKIQKIYEHTNHLTNLAGSADIIIFSPEISRVFYIDRMQRQIAFCYIISNSFNFFDSLKIFLTNIVAVLMMSTKKASLGLIKINSF